MALFSSSRERTLGGMTALALLIGGGYLFVYQPGVAFFDELDGDIDRVKETWAEKKVAYENSRRYRARFERIQESLALAGNETEQEMKIRIAQELTALLELVDLKATRFSEPNVELIEDDFRIYSYKLTGIDTDWKTLSTLLYEIENSDAVLEVSGLTVRKAGGRRSSTGALKVDMEISRLVEFKTEKRKKSRGRGSRRS